MRSPVEEVETITLNDVFYVFGKKDPKDDKLQVRLIDKRGFIKVQCSDAAVGAGKSSDCILYKLWKQKLGYSHEMLQTPDIFLCINGKVLDYTNVPDYNQLITIMKSEFLDSDPDDDIIVISSRRVVL